MLLDRRQTVLKGCNQDSKRYGVFVCDSAGRRHESLKSNVSLNQRESVAVRVVVDLNLILRERKAARLHNNARLNMAGDRRRLRGAKKVAMRLQTSNCTSTAEFTACSDLPQDGRNHPRPTTALYHAPNPAVKNAFAVIGAWHHVKIRSQGEAYAFDEQTCFRVVLKTYRAPQDRPSPHSAWSQCR